MARAFAGFLSGWAVVICVVRGLTHQADPIGTLQSALAALWAFAAIGYVTGWIAQRVVQESFAVAQQKELQSPSGGPDFETAE